MEESNNSSHIFTSEFYTKSVIDGYHELWKDGILCDTELLVGDQAFQVHRSFLAAGSPFFRVMFTTDFKEQQQSQVELKGISPESFDLLLNFAYTSRIEICFDNLVDILTTASYLQFDEVISFCEIFMLREMRPDKCIHFLQLATLYNLKKCKKKIEKIALTNFLDVSRSVDFMELSLDAFAELLASDQLSVKSEMDVFDIASTWISSQDDKATAGKKVLPRVRYGLIASEQMHLIYRTVHDLVGGACNDILQRAASYHVAPHKQPSVCSSGSVLGRMRCPVEGVVLVGGGIWNDEHLTKHFYFSDFNSECVFEDHLDLGPIRDGIGCESMGAVVANDFLYIAGGVPHHHPKPPKQQTSQHAENSSDDDFYDYSHDEDDEVSAGDSKVFRYDPRTKQWLELQAMKFGRTVFVLTAIDNYLLAVGGQLCYGHSGHKSVEMYNVPKNEWHAASDLPTVLFSHAGCTLNGEVYISGGHTGSTSTPASHDLLCYNITNNQWTRRCPMHWGRASHIMVPHIDCLFVCTGYTGRESSPFENIPIQYNHNIECYDTTSDQWTCIEPGLPYGCYDSAAVCHNDKIYIFGGCGKEIQMDLQIYDIAEDEWSMYEWALPRRIANQGACVLKIPNTKA